MKKVIVAVIVVLALVIAAPFAWGKATEGNCQGMMDGMMGGMMGSGMSQMMMNFDSPEFQQHIEQMQKFHGENGITCPGLEQMTGEPDKTI